MKNSIFTILACILLTGIRLNALQPGKDVRLKKTKPLVEDNAYLYLAFDEMQGRSVINQTKPGANDAALANGDLKLVPGLFEKALATVPGSFLTVPQPGAMRYSLTIEFWLNPGSTDQNTALLTSLNDTQDRGYRISLLEDNRIEWLVCHEQGVQTAISTNRSVPSDQWNKISFVFGSIPGQGGVKGYRIYINGYVAGEVPSYAAIDDRVETLTIAAPVKGLLDELAITPSGREIYPEVENAHLPAFNLDFEQKEKGWIGVYDNCKIDDHTKHGGNASLRIETDDLYTREYLSPLFSVEPGASYRITFWAKVEKFEKGFSALGVWMRWYFEPEETCSYGGDLVAHHLTDQEPRTFDWKRFEAVLQVPAGEKQRKDIHWARFQVKNYHSHVTAWVDDISIEKVK